MSKIKGNRVLSIILAISMISGMSTTVFAADNEVTESGGKGNSNLTLKVEDSGSGGTDPDDPDKPPVDPPAILIATVPVELPIVMDMAGKITVPTNAKIINNVEDKGIKVTGIDVALESGWNASDYSTIFDETNADQQKIALSMRGDELNADGTYDITEGNWNIAKNGQLPLNMGAKIPIQTAEKEVKIATIEFTVDWSGDDTSPDTYKVTYTAGAHGTISGPVSADFNDGDSLTFPNLTPDNGYILDKWIDTTTGLEVTTSTFVTSDMTLEAVFKAGSESTYKVTFLSDGNGSLQGSTEISVKEGETPVFPTPVPANFSVEFVKWLNADTNEEISTATGITSDTRIKAIFQAKAMNPGDWFSIDMSGQITGFTDSYNNMVNAPTDIVIPNQIGATKVVSIGASMFQGKTALTSVVLPDTVTSISDNAFKGCTDLATVYVPTGLKSIGASSFEGCSSLTSVDLPTSVTTIGTRAFANCTALRRLSLPALSNATKAGNSIIAGCADLELTLLSSIKNIGSYEFNGVTGLKSLVMSDELTGIYGNTFSGCTGLTSITLSNNLTGLPDYAFAQCASLKEINIPASVTTVGAKTFNLCDSMTINIAGEAYRFAGAPWGATNTTVVWKDLPPAEEWDTNPMKSTDLAALGMRVYGTKKDGIGLSTTVARPSGDINLPTSIDGVKTVGLYSFKNVTEITSINIPSTYKTIAANALEGCTGIKSLTIPSSIESIGALAFTKCTGLTEIIYGVNKADAVAGAPWGAPAPIKFLDEEFDSVAPIEYLPDQVPDIVGGAYTTEEATKYGYELEGTLIKATINSETLNKIIELPTSINGTTITGIHSLNKNGNWRFKSVIVPEGYNEIRSNLPYLAVTERIDIPSTVTVIGNNIFDSYSSITVRINNTYNNVKNMENFPFGLDRNIAKISCK